MTKETHSRSLKYYLFLIFFLTFGTGFTVFILGGTEGLSEYPLLSNFIMFFPAISAIIVTVPVEKNIKLSDTLKALGLRIGKVKYLIVYPLFTFILIICSYLVTYLIAPNIYVPGSELPEILSGLSVEFGSLSVPLQIISIFLINLSVGAIFNIPLMLGEELG